MAMIHWQKVLKVDFAQLLTDTDKMLYVCMSRRLSAILAETYVNI